MKNKLFRLRYQKGKYNNYKLYYKLNDIFNYIGYWGKFKYRCINNNSFGIKLTYRKHEK